MSGVYLAPGAHTLTATFAGDTLDATSTSAPINSSVTIATTAAGIHRITANYSGDTNDAPVVSAPVVQQVAQQSGVTLTSSANPSLLTDNITLSTTVSNGVAGSVPTGKVTLTDGGTSIASATLDANGAATFPITAPTAGTHNYVVSYAGDDQNVPATSTTLVQIVKLRPSTTTLSASATAISTGQQLVIISGRRGVPTPGLPSTHLPRPQAISRID